jgi:hypothetical protein
MKILTAATLILIVAAIIIGRNGLPSAGVGADWTIYGSMSCGWTRKQIDHMKENGIAYKFVDCAKSKCEGINGFPTTIHKSGMRLDGYNEIFSNRE